MAVLNVPTNVRLGRVRVYTAPLGQADPVTTSPLPVAWVYMGWMSAASTLMNTVGTLDINVDDSLAPVDTLINSRAAGLDGSFAEFVGQNVNIIVGGILTSVAAGAGASGYDLNVVHSDDDITRKAVLVENIDPREVAAGTNLPIGRLRVYFPYATIQPNGNIDLSRKREASLPFSIRAHPALNGSGELSRMYLITAVGV